MFCEQCSKPVEETDSLRPVCEACKEKKRIRDAKRRRAAAARREAYASCGMVKVRGNLGGIYYE